MAPAAMIGVLCGLLAIGFTVINLKVARLRIQVMQVGLCAYPGPGLCRHTSQAMVVPRIQLRQARMRLDLYYVVGSVLLKAA